MKSAKFQWLLPSQNQTEQTDEFLKEISARHLSPLLGNILWQRGIHTVDDLGAFFSEDLKQLHDPYLMYDMDRAISRIQRAVIEGERILVYGDYDADGITSTTIMKETLEMLGADVEYFLPNRFLQGYGPNKEKYAEKIAEGIQLIITVDNGVAGHEAISYAQSQGVDVIVTDHHELPEELPEAFAIIHPRHPEGHYPFGELAGVGVAFKVATALLEEPPYEFLDLVAIGTVADLVSLTRENRLLVKAGLKAIHQTERVGLIKLFEKSGLDITTATETSIGFSVGPRLNAIGRLGDPNPAVQLMTTFDEEEADSLADSLDKQNTERKAIVETITTEAMTMIDPANQIHLLAKKDWHEGVLGIVAGNIVQQTGRPAILLAIKEDGTAKGSGRSVEALNLFEMLDSMRDLFLHFGGHHAAVGLTLPAESIDLLQEKMNEYVVNNQLDLTSGAQLLIDGEIKPEETTVELVESLNQLAPFGTDNPLPHFLLKNIQPVNVKVLGNGQQHLKFSIETADQLEVIAFNFGTEAAEFEESVDIVGQLSINEWNGFRKPQIQLTDYLVEGFQLFDRRGKRNYQQPLDKEATLIVSFHESSRKILEASLQENVVNYTSMEQLTEVYRKHPFKQLAILDIPKDLSELKELLHLGSFSRVYLYGFSKDEAYLNGMGTREQYARLFRLIHSQEKIDIRYKLNQIADYLKIPKSLLVFMINVFSELKFVTIKDGVLSKTEVKENHPLTDSSLYQQRQQQIKNEELLLLSDSEQIKTWLLQ